MDQEPLSKPDAGAQPSDLTHELREAEQPHADRAPSQGLGGPPAAEPAAQPGPTASSAAQLARFPVVGIGASAGGLEALEALVPHLSPRNMAFIVYQHLAHDRESLLPSLLARRTLLPVVNIQDGMAIEPDHIYVAPAGVDVTLKGATLCTSIPQEEPHPCRSIDRFMCSLASEQGSLAIGVILSGCGSDGTLGLKAVKDHNGITFAQDPATALQRSMPQSALDAGHADFSLSPSKIADELMHLGTHAYVTSQRPRQRAGADQLGRILALLRSASGVDFTEYKRVLIERRIERRMALHRLSRIEDYLRYLEENASEQSTLFGDLLVGATSFFRDREVFEALKATVLPRLIAGKSGDDPIRIWAVGTSTGEEVYSIAICLIELLGDRCGGRNVQLFGTDLDEGMLARARCGVYPRSIELDVSAERLHRFFSRSEKGYQICRQIRDMVVFARHDISHDPPFSHLDLVSCRNVLIYMQPSLQRKVLRTIHYALNRDGLLVLGTSESLGDAADFFSLVEPRLKLYVRKSAYPTTGLSLRSAPWGAAHGDERRSARSPEPTRMMSIQQTADRKVLERYGPPGVIIDQSMDVIQFRGKTGPFLEPAPGAATLNIFKLARLDLLAELRAAIHRASTENVPVTSPSIRLRDGAGKQIVIIDVVPLAETEDAPKCWLVLFREAPLPEATVISLREGPANDPRILDLEREILITKEHFHSTLTELQSANEELQSTNEEFQLTNEELQSANEELEASKEELQGYSEEISAMNDELKHRIAQLDLSNDDLQNIMASIETPLVIVGMDLRIRCFSASAERMLKLIPGDIGRSVGYLKGMLSGADVEQMVAEAVNATKPAVFPVRCAEGAAFSLKIAPYRTAEHAIRGAVIEVIAAPS